VNEYRITGSPTGGYWPGVAGRTWTNRAEAEAALTEYQTRVNADTFTPAHTRDAHLDAVHIETRDVTPWHPLNPDADPRAGDPLPTPTSVPPGTC
jgi:hypothetical protein